MTYFDMLNAVGCLTFQGKFALLFSSFRQLKHFRFTVDNHIFKVNANSDLKYKDDSSDYFSPYEYKVYK
ncbi:hypothetical protein PIROE2DRAFT_16814 [Piromyces sp. E2]|nr:hypothetical protein PIROE2DRAFT_16814 [Piromyces sp. E2]|eukprot:OUM58019.1 hypothetical protein PIROE2DRAFT_16814 [Piromyces sp. E2]